MNRFSKSSQEKLNTCHPDLQRILNKALQIHDCTILYGIRTIDEQKKLVAEGKSRTLNSKHLVNPDTGYSDAVDVAPFPIDWDDAKRFYYFAGIVKGVAESMNIKIRWGGDWDSDNDLDDQRFMDLVHFELRR